MKNYNWHSWNTKDYKRQEILCQEKGQPGRNGQILRKVQTSKCELGRNRKYK